ncbi:hypothetical protein GCM10009557_26190 [Virgisporangium ochraceum]
MRQTLCPVLVGRDEEVGVLADALGRAGEGHGGTVFVVGEAGVGKSRLVRELSERARARQLPVLTGRAVPGGVPAALRPLAEAVLGELRGRGELDAPELRPFRPALGRLVPQWLPAGSGPGVESSVVLGEGLLRLLRFLAGGRGCVLVLEDLHWADPESLAVLEYLTDNLAGERILCLGTVRSEQEGAGRALVANLVDRRAARVVQVAGLGDEAIVRVARACLGAVALPTEVETFLCADADGLPFLVEELLAGLVGAGVLVERNGRWATTAPLWEGRRVPPTFADAVGRRLDGLSDGACDVLRAAAVFGRRFDWSLLPATTGLGEADVVEALREALGVQLLTAEADGFRFRHALTRDAVLGGLLPPERASLARSALSAVEHAHPRLPGEWCELAAELSPTRVAALFAGSLLRRGRYHPRALTSAIRELRRPDPSWWQRLTAITAPALVLSGGPRSHLASRRTAEVAAELPDGRFVTIPVGHRIHSLAPDDFRDAVLPFLM